MIGWTLHCCTIHSSLFHFSLGYLSIATLLFTEDIFCSVYLAYINNLLPFTLELQTLNAKSQQLNHLYRKTGLTVHFIASGNVVYKAHSLFSSAVSADWRVSLHFHRQTPSNYTILDLSSDEQPIAFLTLFIIQAQYYQSTLSYQPFGYPESLAQISENFLTHLILASPVSPKNLQLNPIHPAVTSSLSLPFFLNQCLIDIFSPVPCLINMSLAAGSVPIISKLLLSHQFLKKKICLWHYLFRQLQIQPLSAFKPRHFQWIGFYLIFLFSLYA